MRAQMAAAVAKALLFSNVLSPFLQTIILENDARA